MKTCFKVFVALMFSALVFGTVAVAEIAPFEYSFVEPTANDLTLEDAVAIADAYFSSHSDRVVIHHEDVSQYERTTSFIRIAQEGEPMYCWVVAYNDGTHMLSGYGFVGMVIVNSPDGRIIDYCSDSYWKCFADWESASIFEDRSYSEIYGAIDMIALPQANRVKHIMPDMYTIREEEALKIANQLVAGYQHIAEDDVKLEYSISMWLDQDLLVSDHPIWRIQYIHYQDSVGETLIQDRLQYTVAVYAHTGTVWYVIDHISNQVVYANHSGCHMPILEESFEPSEWLLSNYDILFGTP